MHIRQSSNHYNNVTEKSLNFYEELKKNIQSIKKKPKHNSMNQVHMSNDKVICNFIAL